MDPATEKKESEGAFSPQNNLELVPTIAFWQTSGWDIFKTPGVAGSAQGVLTLKLIFG